MNKIWLVAKETYRREVKTWSYLLMILAPFLFVLLSFVIGMASAGSSDDNYIGVVTANPVLKQAIKKSEDFDNYSTEAKAKKAYKDEDIDGYVLIEQKNNQLAATYYSDEKIDSDLKSELLTSLNAAQQQLNLSKAKLTIKQSQSLATRAQFKQKVKHVDKKNFDNDPVKQISFWVLLIILYMLVITYTQVTAQDIATEKGTKIMEVIFSSMPGGDYFTGKILGIFGEIITQVLIYVVGFVAVYCAAPYIDGFSDLFRQYKPMIDQAIGNLASWGLVFTIIGLVLFIIFAAFCGALVAKSENANKAVGPLSTLMLIGFLFTVNMQSGGDTIFAKVLSYIPFLSSFVMPARVIMGNATNLEAAISALIALAATVASFIWIRKIYPNLILQTDDVGPWQNFKRSLRG